ncbi:IclR family transcriptional regulator [Caproicibacter fermentans]|nr:IclR family transcriptional regulator [Caproicibacter fermentans]
MELDDMPKQHRSTARVLDVLEYLATEGQKGCTLSELSAALNAPKSSLFPILHTLADRKYVYLDKGTGRYSIGIGTYALGRAFTAGRDALELILKAMEAIVRSCEETCQLAVLDKEKVLYIGKVDSPQAIRLVSSVGARLPANCTALGKALLSGLKDEEILLLFKDRLCRMTDRSITDIQHLLAQIRAIRKGGIAWEHEESTDHVCCYAVPLRKGGKVFAAVSVSFLTFRSTPEKERLVRESLVKAQAEIEQIAEERGFVLKY